MYKILDFSDIVEPRLKNCCGVLGYLFVHRHYNGRSYVSAKFIKALSDKCKTNLIEYLITNNYIVLLPPDIKERDNEVNDDNYKSSPNFYKPLIRLYYLQEVNLTYKTVEDCVFNNLHHLNGITFNHYRYVCSKIKFKISQKELDSIITINDHTSFLKGTKSTMQRPVYLSNQLFWLKQWGKEYRESYNMNIFGFDDKFSGTHHNLFMNYENGWMLFDKTSLIEPIEVGVYTSNAVLLADQLYKAFGKNEFSSLFIKEKIKSTLRSKSRIPKRIKKFMIKVKTNPLVYMPKPLFDSYILDSNGFDLYSYIDENITGGLTKYVYNDKEGSSTSVSGELIFNNAVFGYRYTKRFAEVLPKTYELLYKIKGAKKGTTYFENFVANMKKRIYKNEIRIRVNGEDVFKSGQIYYKVIALVIQRRRVEIAKKIWFYLVKNNILFIPYRNNVIIQMRDFEKVAPIVYKVWKEYINKEITFYIEL